MKKHTIFVVVGMIIIMSLVGAFPQAKAQHLMVQDTTMLSTTSDSIYFENFPNAVMLTSVLYGVWDFEGMTTVPYFQGGDSVVIQLDNYFFFVSSQFGSRDLTPIGDAGYDMLFDVGVASSGREIKRADNLERISVLPYDFLDLAVKDFRFWSGTVSIIDSNFAIYDMQNENFYLLEEVQDFYDSTNYAPRNFAWNARGNLEVRATLGNTYRQLLWMYDTLGNLLSLDTTVNEVVFSKIGIGSLELFKWFTSDTESNIVLVSKTDTLTDTLLTIPEGMYTNNDFKFDFTLSRYKLDEDDTTSYYCITLLYDEEDYPKIRQIFLGGLPIEEPPNRIYQTSKIYPKIYPNPTRGRFSIAFDDFDGQEFTVEIIDANGQIVYKDKLKEKVNPLDMSDKASGIYTLHIYNQRYSRVLKLVVE